MNKRIIIYLYLAILLSSCSIHGSFQGLYSYYDQVNTNIPHILMHTDAPDLCALYNSTEPRVYIINGLQLKRCVKEQKNAIVYIWKPNCHAGFCYSLNALQKKCDSLHTELFIVAEYYDEQMMKIPYSIKRPIFAIDTRYYKSDKTSKYRSRFFADMESPAGKGKGHIMYFQNGVYIKSVHNIDSLSIGQPNRASSGF